MKWLTIMLIVPLSQLWAERTYYASGLPREIVELNPAGERDPEKQALQRFLREHFTLPSGAEWISRSAISDAHFVHRLFDLRYRGRRVLDHHLNTHYHRDGWIAFASSTWEHPLYLMPPPSGDGVEREIRQRLTNECRRLYGNANVTLGIERVIWVDEKSGEAHPALDVELTTWGPLSFRHLIYDEASGSLLEELRVIRTVDVSARVYPVSPLAGALELKVLTGLDDSSTLRNAFFRVRREENTSVPVLVDVNPNPDFEKVSGFSTDPHQDSYKHDCTGSAADACPNQGIEAVNTYYHLNEYRKQTQSYFSTLGVSTAAIQASDPLQVIINSLNIDINGNGSGTDETNNAAYVPKSCRQDGSIPRCLIFLRPATGKTSSCGSSSATVKFFHLAREANVVVHEYQHYITDRVAQLIAGTLTEPNVGDALHEGYSDYLAASQVSRLLGANSTKIGEYAFQNCAPIIRDVATLRVYQDNASDNDPHLSGLSWASGLWQLRNELGGTKADLLALQSLFFLSVKPGFIEAVDALVRADQIVNGGANISRIRRLFYDEIRFVGGRTGVFRDSENQVAEVGFQSCSSVRGRRPEGAIPSLFALITWLAITCFAGRRKWNPGER